MKVGPLRAAAILVLACESAATLGADGPGPRWLAAARSLQVEVDAANQRDLQVLWGELQEKRSRMGDANRASFPARLGDRLKSDKAIYRKLRAEIVRSGAMPTTLVSVIKKLAGTDAEGATAAVPSVLDEARSLIEGPRPPIDFARPFDPSPFGRHRLTVLKHLLVHALVVASGEKNLSRLVGQDHLERRVQLFYPVPVPGSLQSSPFLGQLGLCSSTGKPSEPAIFWYPNAGYIFGGAAPIATPFRGTDSGGFLTVCLNSKVRISNAYFEELIAVARRGASPLTKAKVAAVDRKFGAMNPSGASYHFEIFEPKSADGLKPGDVVHWTHPTPGVSGAVLVQEALPSKPGEFRGIGDNLNRDRGVEGICTQDYKLHRREEGYRAMVLRPSPIPSR